MRTTASASSCTSSLVVRQEQKAARWQKTPSSVAPACCAAIEDSHGGIRSAKAAGLRVLAIPNPSYPPDEESLSRADVVLRSLAELTRERVDPDS